MEYTRNFRNDLLKRTEVEFVVNSVSNLGFEGAKNSLVDGGHDAESIVVRAVRSNFGARDFLVEAFIYDSKEHKESIEPQAKKPKSAGGK